MLRLRDLVVVTAVLLATPVGSAAATGTPGGACTPSAPSAVNQYCEDIPSAGGGHQVGAGTRVLAQSLPAAVVNRIVRAAASGRPRLRRTLLGLPAPARVVAAMATRPLVPASAGGLSSWWGLAVVVVLIAVGFASIAAWRRRRAQPAPVAAADVLGGG